MASSGLIIVKSSATALPQEVADVPLARREEAAVTPHGGPIRKSVQRGELQQKAIVTTRQLASTSLTSNTVQPKIAQTPTASERC